MSRTLNSQIHKLTNPPIHQLLCLSSLDSFDFFADEPLGDTNNGLANSLIGHARNHALDNFLDGLFGDCRLPDGRWRDWTCLLGREHAANACASEGITAVDSG